MNVFVPPEIERQLTEADAALHLAIGLFIDGRVTLGQGATVAALSTSAFLAELGKRRIPVHYDLEDARSDISTVSGIAPR